MSEFVIPIFYYINVRLKKKGKSMECIIGLILALLICYDDDD